MEQIISFLQELYENNALPFAEKVDKALYTVACKAAVKAHEKTGEHDDRYILENILKMDLRYGTCCRICCKGERSINTYGTS